MPIHPKSLLNLRPKPFNSETGRLAGSKPKSSLQNTINAMENGLYVKHKGLKELITPTPTEKAMGITKSDKLQALKRLNPLFGADSSKEFLEGVEELLGKALLDIMKREDKGLPVHRELMKISTILHQHHDRKFGSMNPHINIINQQIGGDSKLTMMEVHEKVMKKLQVYQNETEEAHSRGEGFPGLGEESSRDAE
jgi:hypothetical protein